MQEFNPILRDEIAKQQKNMDLYGLDYAIDLKTHSQKVRRMKNIAIVNAAKEYNKQHLLGYTQVRDSVALSEDRAIHYGCRVGDVVGRVYVKGKDYNRHLCKTILAFRKQCRLQESICAG